jgi:hypothetical protein
VTIDSLIVDPYSLDWGSSIWAKVSATNIIGASDYSLPGNGAQILTVPTAPQTLVNNVAVTNKDQVGITWYEGVQSSGTPVIDYRVWYTTVDDDNYQILVSN